VTTATPMMQQYHEAKTAAGDALLLFRMGDFYELFFEDAKTAARTLGLALTSRDKGDNPVPMAGFPYHQLDGYLAKIIAAGHRAAICEQVEDPKQAKGLVKREVTRIVTPGTLTDDALLDPAANNFLAAVARQRRLWDRGDALRNAHRPPPLRYRRPGATRRDAPHDDATFSPQLQPRYSYCSRTDHPQGPLEGTLRPLPNRRPTRPRPGHVQRKPPHPRAPGDTRGP